MGTDPEIHNWTIYGVRDFATPSHESGKKVKFPLLRVQERRQRVCKSQTGWMTPRKWSLTETTGLMHI